MKHRLISALLFFSVLLGGLGILAMDPNRPDVAMFASNGKPSTVRATSPAGVGKGRVFDAAEASEWTRFCGDRLASEGGGSARCACVANNPWARMVARSVLAGQAASDASGAAPAQSVAIRSSDVGQDELLMGIPAFQHCMHPKKDPTVVGLPASR